MERDIEKDLIEIECAIKSQEEKDNIFTMSVLQRCHKLASELKEYRDLEEQGKLLKLPCAVGDTVYHICITENEEPKIIEMKVGCVEPCGAIRNHNGICEIWNAYAETDYTKAYFKFFDFGKTVFLTREEAEAALKELRKVEKNE